MANAFVDKLNGYVPLATAERTMLESACQNVRRLPARYDLVREGDQPGSVYVMLEGWACRYKLLPEGGRQIMAFLMPGDFCDMHDAVLEEMDHSIGTLSPACIATVSRARMALLTVASPALTHAFWRSQLADEGTLRAWIVSMGRRGSVERVAHLMSEIYVRACNIGLAEGPLVELPLSQAVLADALGLTPVHVNRVLRKLRLEGIMEIGNGKLKIADPVGLAKVAGFDENYLHRRLRRLA